MAQLPDSYFCSVWRNLPINAAGLRNLSRSLALRQVVERGLKVFPLRVRNLDAKLPDNDETRSW